MSYPAMSKEFAVAAVTVLSFFLVGGCGGGRAVLRAAVLVLTLLSIIWRMLVPPIPFTAMAFTVRITEINNVLMFQYFKFRLDCWFFFTLRQKRNKINNLSCETRQQTCLQTLGGALMGPSIEVARGSAGGRQ